MDRCQWSFYYLASLGLAVCNTIVLAVIFRFRKQDGTSLPLFLFHHSVANPPRPIDCLLEGGEHVHVVADGKDAGKFKQIMSEKTVHFLAFFILVYVGVEVTIGGWIVTYIIQERNGGPSSGCIASGFFGGGSTTYSDLGFY